MTFAEIGRAQLHGHEIQCLTTLPGGIFVSGAEEKILRVFRIPRTVAESLKNISGEWILNAEKIEDVECLDWGAQVPALGLSNQATQRESVKEAAGDTREHQNVKVHSEEEKPGLFSGEDANFLSKPTVLQEPPTEADLQQNTLWPEQHQLYGHGFELYTVKANPRGTLVVSSCRASQTSHSRLLLWQPPVFQAAPIEIEGHSLTVTECTFSPDGRFLLTVSKDRTAIIYREKNGELDGTSWRKIWQSASKGGVHSRIIWSAAWMADSAHFVTVSRDCKVVLWRWNDSEEKADVLAEYAASESVTAVTAIPKESGGSSLVVMGTVLGRVDLLEIVEKEREEDMGVEKRKIVLRQNILHPGEEFGSDDHAVLGLRVCPRREGDHVLLAIATADKKLRIMELML